MNRRTLEERTVKENQYEKCIVVLLIGTLVLCQFGCGKKDTNKIITDALTPLLDEQIKEANEESELSDISYEIRIDKSNFSEGGGGLKDWIYSHGDIIFLSNDINNYEPETMYKIMRQVSEEFFSDLVSGDSSTININDDSVSIDFTFDHGTGTSRWKMSDGTIYEANYGGLEKDKKEIYKNSDFKLSEADQVVLDAIQNSDNDKENKYQPVTKDDEDFFKAVAAAQDLVKDKLKAPSTAEFPWSGDEYTVSRNGNDWKITGYVDAENSFGAKLRTNWTVTCTLENMNSDKIKITNSNVILDE